MKSSNKILIISNNPLTYSSSNGRTLLNMLGEYKKDQIYNFYISGNDLLFERCHYFQISDHEAIKACYKKINLKEKRKDDFLKCEISNKNHGYGKKTFFKINFRDLIWRNKRIYRTLLKWCKTIEPDVILFQLGDTNFLIDIVLKLHNDLNVRLVTYSSEDYYFKDFDYINKKVYQTHSYKRWYVKYKKKVNQLIACSARSIYLTDDLRGLYENEFPFHKGVTIYNSSDIKSSPKEVSSPDKYFIYSGNTGVGRLEELNKIGQIIKEIDNSFELRVYSKLSNEDLNNIQNYEFINYCGYVSYKENITLIKKAYGIFLVDSFDEFYLKDTCHSFSTKIADSLGSLNCVVAYTPSSSSMSNYLKENNCAYVANDLNDLKKVLITLISKKDNRFNYIKNAEIVFDKNHQSYNNSLIFKSVIEETINRPIFQLLVTTMNKNFDEMIELANYMHIDSDAIIRSQCGYVESKIVDYNGHRLMLVCANDRGLSKNRNELFNLSDADYVLFSDDDEIFNHSYLAQMCSDIKRFKNPDLIEYSFDNTTEKYSICFKKYAYNKNRFLRFGIWNMCLNSSFIKRYNLRQNEMFGAGTPFCCGEDTIFRTLVYSLSNATYSSPFLLMNINDNHVSTSLTEITFDYIKARSTVYGYSHRFLFPLYIFRMRYLQKNKVIFGNFWMLLKYGFLGRKLFKKNIKHIEK